MKKYKVWVSWEVGASLNIEATSEEEARKIAMQSSAKAKDEEYVCDSFRVNDVEEIKDEP